MPEHERLSFFASIRFSTQFRRKCGTDQKPISIHMAYFYFPSTLRTPRTSSNICRSSNNFTANAGRNRFYCKAFLIKQTAAKPSDTRRIKVSRKGITHWHCKRRRKAFSLSFSPGASFPVTMSWNRSWFIAEIAQQFYAHRSNPNRKF